MSAAILLLTDLGWELVLPNVWHDTANAQAAHFEDSPFAEHQVLEAISFHIREREWRKAAKHFAGKKASPTSPLSFARCARSADKASTRPLQP